MQIAFSALTALLYAVLYAESVRAVGASPPAVWASLTATFLVMLASFLAPLRFFPYSLEDIAPAVLSRLMTRAALSSLLVLLLSTATFLIFGDGSVSLAGELYLFTLMAVLLFHVFGGAVADHVIYLQQTKQYNSNQLAAVLLLVTLLIFVLILYFLSFDLSQPRLPHALIRDLLAITLSILGLSWALYKMAHH